MVECVDDDVRRRGLRAMISGPLRGVPYKIYAVVSGERRHALVPFLLVSVPARAPRLILLAAAAYGLNRLGAGHLSLGAKGGTLGTAWVAFYIWYFCAVRLAATGDSRRTPRRRLESATRHGCPSVVKRSTDSRRMRRTSWLGAKLLPVCFAAITALSLGVGVGVGAAPANSGDVQVVETPSERRFSQAARLTQTDNVSAGRPAELPSSTNLSLRIQFGHVNATKSAASTEPTYLSGLADEPNPGAPVRTRPTRSGTRAG
jgi:hypothetical protein